MAYTFRMYACVWSCSAFYTEAKLKRFIVCNYLFVYNMFSIKRKNGSLHQKHPESIFRLLKTVSFNFSSMLVWHYSWGDFNVNISFLSAYLSTYLPIHLCLPESCLTTYLSIFLYVSAPTSLRHSLYTSVLCWSVCHPIIMLIDSYVKWRFADVRWRFSMHLK